MPLLHQGCMADWEYFGQGKTRNELSHGWRIHKMLTSERIKALKTVIVQKIEFSNFPLLGANYIGSCVLGNMHTVLLT